MLARRIEQRSNLSGAEKTQAMPTDLEDALRVVRMDGEDGP